MTVQEALKLYPEALAWITGRNTGGPLTRLKEAIKEVLPQGAGNTHLAAVLVCHDVMRTLAGAYYELAEQDHQAELASDLREELVQHEEG